MKAATSGNAAKKRDSELAKTQAAHANLGLKDDVLGGFDGLDADPGSPPRSKRGNEAIAGSPQGFDQENKAISIALFPCFDLGGASDEELDV